MATWFEKIKAMNEDELAKEIIRIVNWSTPAIVEVVNHSDLIQRLLKKETK